MKVPMQLCRASSWRSAYALLAVIPLLVSASRFAENSTAAEELQEAPYHPSSATRAERYNVHILIARHGISCANLVSSWNPSTSAMSAVKQLKRGMQMKDPMLASIGKIKSVDAAKRVAKWLQSERLTLDAVLSSVLARAMETALFQFPNKVVTPVPFVRERQMLSADNQVSPLNEQLTALRAAMNSTSFQIDSHFREDWPFDQFAYSAGDWNKFLLFLKDALLPDLVAKAEHRQDIVIALVTHSHFLSSADTTDFNQCKPKWLENQLPSNNQVVRLKYDYVVLHPYPPRKTPTRSLGIKVPATCDEVDPGTPIRDNSGTRFPLCDRDVGDQCSVHAGWATPPTLETAISEKKAIMALLDQADDMDRVKQDVEKKKLEREIAQLAKTGCWSGGKPKTE